MPDPEINNDVKMIKSIAVTDFEGNKVDLLTEYKGLPLLLIIYNNADLGCT